MLHVSLGRITSGEEHYYYTDHTEVGMHPAGVKCAYLCWCAVDLQTPLPRPICFSHVLGIWPFEAVPNAQTRFGYKCVTCSAKNTKCCLTRFIPQNVWGKVASPNTSRELCGSTSWISNLPCLKWSNYVLHPNPYFVLQSIES